MSGLPSGRLRCWGLFEIFVDDAEEDSDGAHVDGWVPAFAAGSRQPVEVHPLSARELEVAASQGSEGTHRLRVRYRPEFLATGYRMRFTEQRADGFGRRYAITGSIPDHENGQKWITLTAKAGLTDGR